MTGKSNCKISDSSSPLKYSYTPKGVYMPKKILMLVIGEGKIKEWV